MSVPYPSSICLDVFIKTTLCMLSPAYAHFLTFVAEEPVTTHTVVQWHIIVDDSACCGKK